MEESGRKDTSEGESGVEHHDDEAALLEDLVPPSVNQQSGQLYPPPACWRRVC